MQKNKIPNKLRQLNLWEQKCTNIWGDNVGSYGLFHAFLFLVAPIVTGRSLSHVSVSGTVCTNDKFAGDVVDGNVMRSC